MMVCELNVHSFDRCFVTFCDKFVCILKAAREPKAISDRWMEKTERVDDGGSGALHRGADALTRRGVQGLE